MSMERPVTITCPQCGKDFSTTIWMSLDRDLDPDAADELMEGDFFQYKCPHCKGEGPFDFPMLYHDMEASTVIQYVGIKEGDSYQDAIERGRQGRIEELESLKQHGLEDPSVNFVYRIVAAPHVLREKAKLLRDGLDDRVIEVIKYEVLLDMKKSKPDVARDQIRYFGPGKENFLLVSSIDGQEEMITAVAKDYYNSILEKLRKNLPGFEENEDWVVDMVWAENACALIH